MRASFLTLWFLSCTAEILIAQDMDSSRRKILIGVSFEPNFSYRQLAYSHPNSWVEDIRNAVELPKLGYSTGINFRYNYNSKLSFEGAVIYNNHGMTTRRVDLAWDDLNVDFPTESKTTYSYNYVEFPVKANYYIKVDSWTIYLTGGISLNHFVSKTLKTITFDEKGRSDSNKSNVNYGYAPNTYSAILGFGIDIPIKNHWLLNIEPMYRQNFTSISYEPQGKEFFYSGGLNLKLFYHLRKKSR